MSKGRMIAGRYRLVERIGSGAMGVVWRGHDEVLDRTVAVKELLIRSGGNAEDTERARQRALREGRIAARLQHPHAIGVFDVADDDGHPVLVMEYLPSRSLADVIGQRRVLPEGDVVAVGTQVSGALAAAHAAGIVHRDIKPGNVLIAADGTAKITDFGISRAVGDVTVTATGLFAGTPAYLAPEVARGSDPSAASDVFSLGSTLYTAVEGAPPFGTNDNAIALLHAVASGRVLPPHRASQGLAALLMRMLADDPAARPTMAAIHAELTAMAGGSAAPRAAAAPTLVGPTLATAAHPAGPAATRLQPATTFGEQAPGRSRRRAGIVLLGVLLLAGLVALVLALGDSTTGGPTSAAPTTTTAPSSTEAAPAPDLAGAVAQYYALMPEDPEAGWARLGPGLRAQGYPAYERFWKSIKDVTVSSAPRADGDTVVVGVDFVVGGGDVYREVHRLGMVVRDGVALIDSDTLVSSTKLSGGEGEQKKSGKESEDDKDSDDGGKGKKED